MPKDLQALGALALPPAPGGWHSRLYNNDSAAAQGEKCMTPSKEMTARQTLFLAGKIAFAVGVVAWLFHKVNAGRVWDHVARARPAPVALGILLCLFTVVIAGWRWKRLLGVVGISVPLGPLICIAQIGQFFLMFLPGPVGDDLTRMLYISRLTKGRAGEACATVLLDRILGMSSVLVLAVLCVPWQWRLLSASRQTSLLAVGMVAVGAAICLFGAVFFVAGHPTHAWFERRLRSLPATNIRDELARMWGLLCANKRVVAEVISAAFVTQLLCCGFYCLAGVAVGIPASPLLWFGFLPIVIAANAVPITVAGFGVREYLLVLFLGVLVHADRESALAVSLVVFSVMLAVSLIGGLVYILYRPQREEE